MLSGRGVGCRHLSRSLPGASAQRACWQSRSPAPCTHPACSLTGREATDDKALVSSCFCFFLNTAPLRLLCAVHAGLPGRRLGPGQGQAASATLPWPLVASRGSVRGAAKGGVGPAAGGRRLHGRGEGPLHLRGFPWEPKSPRAAKRQVPAFLETKTVREVVPPRPWTAPPRWPRLVSSSPPLRSSF